ncbi:hypothetical protein B0H11DRAFT_2095644 [Mycena galericulata]|nr:hypothetical protein B0H11DRAFT_2095644 [Mycena galericulata]
MFRHACRFLALSFVFAFVFQQQPFSGARASPEFTVCKYSRRPADANRLPPRRFAVSLSSEALFHRRLEAPFVITRVFFLKFFHRTTRSSYVYPPSSSRMSRRLSSVRHPRRTQRHEVNQLIAGPRESPFFLSYAMHRAYLPESRSLLYVIFTHPSSHLLLPPLSFFLSQF